MYEDHWKLSDRPFENSFTRSANYYPAECHQAGLLKLRYSIENRRGVAMLCGPSGIGKSLLIHLLKQQLPENYGPVVTINYPILSPPELVRYVAESLQPGSLSNSHDSASALIAIERSLRNYLQAGQHPVIVFEEAHLLENHGGLEVIRLLVNLLSGEADGESVWTIILSGLPTLLAHTHRYQPLDERFAVKCLISPFTQDETVAYIQHRLRGCGGEADTIFRNDALDLIHTLSGGIPRRINRLADLTLMFGFAEDRRQITGDLVESVQADLLPGVIT